MRGGSLTHYRPEPSQGGGGFVKDIVKGAIVDGWKGLNSGRIPLTCLKGAKGHIKRGVKRKALNYISTQAKRRLDNIFGE